MCNLCIDFALNMKRKRDIIFSMGYLPLGVSMLFKCFQTHRRQYCVSRLNVNRKQKTTNNFKFILKTFKFLNKYK